ncbi:MAG TPA: dTDP-glucose 4,6-dehydratase [Fimbriimonadaceae bacterium]|nr:dTDP-glucose 4,6-dehydratase [Fimbriimonadaceae bacterium]
MTVLVTGAAGFIGSNFVRLLRRERPSWRVVVLDALTYAGNEATMADFAATVPFIKGEIQDAFLLDQIIEEHGITHIVNFAAETHNDRSILSAARFIESNVTGPYMLLEAVRKHGLQKLVHVSTDEVYGSILEGEFTEASPLEPNTPYSASKAGGDLQCRSHFVSFGTPVCITRGGNTYGPFQYPEKLISFFAVRLLEGKKVPLYGEGSQIREWIHVDDHARGVLKVLEEGETGQAYNIGDSNERTNLEITRVLLEATGRDESFVKRIPDPRKGAHDTRYSMSTKKLESLGWKPEVDFESGLQRTVEWYRDNPAWWELVTAKPEYVAFIQRFYGPGLAEDL